MPDVLESSPPTPPGEKPHISPDDPLIVQLSKLQRNKAVLQQRVKGLEAENELLQHTIANLRGQIAAARAILAEALDTETPPE